MDVHLAILQLGKNNNEYTVTDDCSKIREWRGSDPQPTETELTEAWTAWQAAATAVKYKSDRKAEYPDWGTQFDYIYHNGIDKWKTDIVDPVKAKYPKPS